MQLDRTIIRVAAILGALAVLLGAFGAHGLKPLLDPSSLENWKTASQYHFIHALALLATAGLSMDPTKKRRSTFLFLSGILCFSGSLYLLSTKTLHGMPVGILGPITPLGGLLLASGWLNLIMPSGKP